MPSPRNSTCSKRLRPTTPFWPLDKVLGAVADQYRQKLSGYRNKLQELDVLCVDNFFTGTKDNIAHLVGNPYFRGRNLQPRLSGRADSLPVRPGPDDEDKCARRDQHARACQARQGKDPPGFHQ